MRRSSRLALVRSDKKLRLLETPANGILQYANKEGKSLQAKETETTMRIIDRDILEARDKVTILEAERKTALVENRSADAADITDRLEIAKRHLENIEHDAAERKGSEQARVF